MTYRILVKHPYCTDEGLSCVLSESYATPGDAAVAIRSLDLTRAKHIDGTKLNSYRFEIIRSADSLAEAAHFIDQELDRNLDEDDESVAVAR